MAFNKTHYKQIKAFVTEQLNSVPALCNVKCPFEWAKTFLPLIPDCLHREDYEGAKGTSDAIREFLNRFLDEPIAPDVPFNLPEFKEVEIKGIICFVGSKDPLSSRAEWV